MVPVSGIKGEMERRKGVDRGRGPPKSYLVFDSVLNNACKGIFAMWNIMLCEIHDVCNEFHQLLQMS